MPVNPSRRRVLFVFSLVLAVVLALWPTAAWAQQEEYSLNISRDFGYSNGSSQVRGNFTASIVGQLANVKEVTYLMDGESMGAVATSPYKLHFVTTNYPLGWHDLSAQVLTKDGRNIVTAVRRFEFASAEQESAAVRNIIFPLLGGLVLVIAIVIGVQLLLNRNKPKVSLELGAARQYGISGGAICPRCRRPFAIHWWALNAGITSKIDRCDHCGRFGYVRRASREELAAAEAAELQMAQPETPLQAETEAQKLKNILDESRYTDKS